MSDAFSCALRLLTRREHGAKELADKLVQKGYDAADASAALAKCQELGLQSDERFAEHLCRVRTRQGYGPVRIRQELQSKQLSRELIEDVLQEPSLDWLACAQEVQRKKYGQHTDVSPALLQKQKQFLLYRGFPMDIIMQVFRS